MPGILGFLIFAVYSVMAIRTTRKHYLARHGVSVQDSQTARARSTAVGLVWPLALLMPGLLKPNLCTHLRHVEMRTAARIRLDNYEQALLAEEAARARIR